MAIESLAGLAHDDLIVAAGGGSPSRSNLIAMCRPMPWPRNGVTDPNRLISNFRQSLPTRLRDGCLLLPVQAGHAPGAECPSGISDVLPVKHR